MIQMHSQNQKNMPHSFKTKNNADGMVLIDQDISDWGIASNAAYMIDSESFIKIASENKLKNFVTAPETTIKARSTSGFSLCLLPDR